MILPNSATSHLVNWLLPNDSCKLFRELQEYSPGDWQVLEGLWEVKQYE